MSDGINIKEKQNSFIKKYKKFERIHRISVLSLSSVAIISGLVFLFMLKAQAEKKSALYIDGNIACYINDESTYENAINRLSENGNLDFGHEVVMETVEVSAKAASESECYDILLEQLQKDQCEAYVVYADGKQIGAFSSCDDAAEAVNSIRDIINETLMSESDNFISAEIVNEFSVVKEENCKQKDLTDKDSLVRTVTDEFKEKVLNNYASNTEYNANSIPDMANQISAVIQTEEKTESINILTEEKTHSDLVCFKVKLVIKETKTEPVAPNIIYVDSEEYRVGQTALAKQGRNGTAEVTYEVEYVAGIEQKRTEISRTVTEQPEDTVIYVGTKPITDPTGELDYPLKDNFYLSSMYGVNRGYYFDQNAGHTGVDLVSSFGTPIYAADGGEVVFAGWLGSYGYMVKLDHGNGMQTWYAHMSEFCVKKGDLVYQGQQIGNVGSTGKSTGPHLHFEVRINLKTVDPLKYLPERDIDIRLCM